MVLCFNVSISDHQTRTAAREQDIKVVSEKVVYRLEEELQRSMELLMPKERIVHVEVSACVCAYMYVWMVDG